MQYRQNFILLLVFWYCLTACAQEKPIDFLYQKAGFTFPYQLAKANKSWALPQSLYEISGLGFIDNQRLACVQDEKGIIYVYNIKAGEIELKIAFGDDGDYEGIEIIEDGAWVLKSNGVLYDVKNFLKKEGNQVSKYPTALTEKNDSEGLAYDPISKNLIIACKGHPFIDGKKENGLRAIYSFNLETRQLDPAPFLTISLDSINYYRNYDAMTKLGAEIVALFDDSNGELNFRPSGIAIHPLTGDIYILGSVGKLLVVFSRTGQMLALISIRTEDFAKPEGICFSPDGKLYISNEGSKQAGTILEFVPQK